MQNITVSVKTPLGALRGTQYITDRGESIYCFQGIPYGCPPTGELRFKDPVPVGPWEGVRSAERPPPPAATVLPGGSTSVSPGSSEDCLYLNVYTPEVPQAGMKLPVIVYLHGGGYTYGCGNKNYYGPDYLVPKEVVLVTINFRLNALGFLSFKNTECPGNYGLKDQNLALKWVQNNIESFGGDRNNVTLSGQSAAASAVNYHMMSPLSRGLFHKVVAMSGSALTRWNYSDFPRESAFLLAKRVGYDGNDASEALEVLRAAPLATLLKHTVGLFQEIEGEWAGENVLGYPFAPTAEPEDTPNAFMTKHPAQALEDGDFMDIPYLTGICDSESIFVLKSADYIPNWDDDLEFQAMLPKELGLPLGSKKLQIASQKLRKYYFPNGTSQEGFIKCNSALMCTHGLVKTVEAHVKNPKKTTPDYLYRFTASRIPSEMKSFFKLDSVKGCCHGDDTDYFFLTKVNPWTPYDPIREGTNDDEVMENYTSIMVNFALTGVPHPDWPAVKDASGNYPYMVIDTDLRIEQGFFADELKFWNELYLFLRN